MDQQPQNNPNWFLANWWKLLLFLIAAFVVFIIFYKGCGNPKPDGDKKTVDSLVKVIQRKDSLVKAIDSLHTLTNSALLARNEDLNKARDQDEINLDRLRGSAAYWQGLYHTSAAGGKIDSIKEVAFEGLVHVVDSTQDIAERLGFIVDEKDKMIIRLNENCDSTVWALKSSFYEVKAAADTIARKFNDQYFQLTKQRSETKFWKTAAKVTAIVIVGLTGYAIAK